MSVVIVMLGLALLLAGCAVWAFAAAARSGQFDDLDTPAIRAVLDEPARDRPH
jgi:cbb3-type cytochrome oxidase maturation protein